MADEPERSERIRVLIVDDHEMFMEGVVRLLEREPAIEVVGTAATMAESIGRAEALRPAVAVVDFQLPDGLGSDAAVAIRAASAGTAVLILTGSTDELVVVAAVTAGCAGVLTKDKAFTELVEAIGIVAAGEAYVDAHVLAAVRPRLTQRGLAPTLTKREREILQLVARGLTNQAISDELFVSLHTVRNHVQNVLVKLQVHSKLEAVFVARQSGLIDDQR
ncbi:MAG: response regulator transcription factor [Actinomycetota bacterium]|nr:response regulator transcription factor [Acidimicrobiia bacterium]MDQ3293256.1 response regulator transcription factor [Actinomycetota bacterium]